MIHTTDRPAPPTTHLLRPRRHRRSRRGRIVAATVVHALTAAVLITAGVFLMVNEHPIRVIEATLGSLLAGNSYAETASATTVREAPGIVFAVNQHWYVLRITTQCAIALYLGPILFLGGILASLRRLPLTRVLAATLAATLGMVLLNQVRFLMLGFVLSTLGQGAFDWAHSLVGSFLMIFGLAGCLILFFRLVLAPTRHRKPRAGSEGGH